MKSFFGLLLAVIFCSSADAQVLQAGSSTTAALPYEQIVASNGQAAQAQLAVPTANQIRLEDRRIAVMGGQQVAHIRLIFSGYYGVDETNCGSDATIEASIEITTAPTPGPIRVTFASSNTGTLVNGQSTLISDKVQASSFGLINIPAGTLAYVKTSSLIGGSGAGFPTCYALGSAQTGEGTAWSNAGSSQVMTPGALTIPPGGSATPAAFTPLVAIVGAFTSKEVSLFLFGDSIMQGLNDTGGSGYLGTNGGTFLRSVWNVNSRNIPYAHAGFSGANSGSGKNISKRLDIAKYTTHGVVNFGTNDLAFGASAASVQANLQTIWTALKGVGIKNVDQSTIIPRLSADSDLYTTLGGQTIQTGMTSGGPRGTLNAALPGNVGSNGLDSVVDLSAAIQDSGITDKFAVNGTNNWMTNDGVHPFSNGLTVGAALLAARYRTYVGRGSGFCVSNC